VATSAYLAAVFLAADAARASAGRPEERELEDGFRRRALVSGLLAGALAIVGLAVLRSDAHPLYHRLLDGPGLGGLIVSIVAGITTLELVRRTRFELARYGAALAVSAIVAGWALAQSPMLLPGLSVQAAAAPHDTLVAVVVAVLAGAVILFPSLALLFRLVLGGTLDHGSAAQAPPPAAGALLSASSAGLLARLAGACLLAGFGLLTVAEGGWAHALGVIALFGFMLFGFFAAAAPARYQ